MLPQKRTKRDSETLFKKIKEERTKYHAFHVSRVPDSSQGNLNVLIFCKFPMKPWAYLSI